MTHNPPTDITPETPGPITDEGEFGLFHLHGELLRLSLDVTALSESRAKVVEAALGYLERKDPNRARLMRHCLRGADALLDEAAHLLNDGIDWDVVEALYYAPDDAFIDTPGHWGVIGCIGAQSVCDGQSVTDPHDKTTAEPAAPCAVPTRASVAEIPAEATPIPAPRPAALRRLGRALRSECETEKQRFYAIAREHGLPTGDNASEAMRAALSELLGEPVASRKQLTAMQWSKAASAIETEDLTWTVAAPKARSATCGSPSLSL